MYNNTENTNELNFTFSYAENPNLMGWLTKFETKTIPTPELNEFFTTYTYSTIIWDGQRNGDNFSYAVGGILDFDNKPDDERQWTIDEAVAAFEANNMAYALITSKSHTSDIPKFHVFIPFNRVVYNVDDYRRVMHYLVHVLYPGSDKKIKDGGRQIFQSPKSAIYRDNFRLPCFNIDTAAYLEPATSQTLVSSSAVPTVKSYKPTTASAKQRDIETINKSDAWKPGTKVRLGNGSVVAMDSVTKLNRAFCNWHEVSDRPSAVVGYSERSRNHFMHCFKCKTTFWKVMDIDVTLANFYSFGKSIYEASISNNLFYFTDIGKDKLAI